DSYIRVMSGRFSFVRWEKRLSTHTLRGLVATPDVDGDGFRDLAAVWNVRGSLTALIETYGSVSGNVLATTTGRTGWVSTIPPLTSSAVGTFPDYDGDGVDDLGVSGGVGLRATLYSGATLAPLASLDNGDRIGFIDIGDVNADGNPDYATTGPNIRSVDPLPVSVTPHELSVTAGGLAPYSIDVGATHAGKLYFVLGSLTGYDPGFRLFGWDVPLNIDPYLIFTATYPNLPILTGSFGLLDGAGKATCNFSLLPDPAFAGLTFHHAAVVFNPVQGFDFVTNARPVTSLP
ncbi:MAG: VCBS repeat-containing protein, partial [Planctomycetota bacterium]